VVLHRILQHASTLVGLAGVAAYLDWRIRRAPPVAVAVRRAGARVAFAGCVVAGVTAAVFRLHLLRIIEPGNVIAAAISGTLAGAIVASLIMRRAALRYRRLVLENVEL
jgi:membrane associated rhomboid family serine protease